MNRTVLLHLWLRTLRLCRKVRLFLEVRLIHLDPLDLVLPMDQPFRMVRLFLLDHFYRLVLSVLVLRMDRLFPRDQQYR